MNSKKIGQQTLALSQPIYIAAAANAVGQKESEGPLSPFFDYADADDTFSQKTWEKAESAMQEKALELAKEKAHVTSSDLDFLFAGDLLNQCIGSAYAARDAKRPFFGLYGACSTMGEGLALASMTLDGGFGRYAAVVASSHFCTAERQYRTPLEYGGQRTPTAQWTVTGAGAVILSKEPESCAITHVTIGSVVDQGIRDTNNMGAAMAPAAHETILSHLRDTRRSPDYYDLIVTGDLGYLGHELMIELFRQDGLSLEVNSTDCGILIFDAKRQDVHCGGSGCGCAASVLTGYLLDGLRAGQWHNILFCPTGALHSPTSAMQGESIPGICHAIALSSQPSH